MRKLYQSFLLPLIFSSYLVSAQAPAGPTAVLHSPYYHAYQPKGIPGTTARIGVLPTRLQHIAARYIVGKTRAQVLLDSISGFLSRQPGMLAVALPTEAKPNNLPDVFFGTRAQELPGTLPGYVQNLKCSSASYNCVQLAGWAGQGPTRKALVELMATQKLDYLLVPMVREASLHLSRKKEGSSLSATGSGVPTDYYLDQGSGHVAPFKRLEDLTGTVGMLVLTAALLDAQGNLVMVGAEGLKSLGDGLPPKRLVVNEPCLALAPDYDALLLPLLRDDLPTPRPAWQEATEQLALRLTGRRPAQADSPYQLLNPAAAVAQH
ncbi:hypothetical protein AUC43_06490 [Hymenobacter sedentarius]|uniref:Uncharacterized protein n=1 Tax=Hymenobacter sedentarius TaxID=1411621 RepID=A0A0U4C9F4_9BACT|nr:hypothetical protein [Hymenobacter sedentarius]ALW84761.1 hypothetical protein AUC43_06490 [Hymenobacter sedentarius]